tara:strand:- start:276 stop:716 length:441 start_codon:yes stop_codon:yes gene_type:complete
MKKLFRKILKFFKNLISKFNVLIQLINALIFTPGYILILLIPVAMVVDLFFPGTTDIVANLSGFINRFIDAGLTGLLTLVALLYVGVLRPFMVLSAVYSAGGINRDMISRVERQNRLDLWFWPSFIIGLLLLVLLQNFQYMLLNQS